MKVKGTFFWSPPDTVGVPITVAMYSKLKTPMIAVGSLKSICSYGGEILESEMKAGKEAAYAPFTTYLIYMV